MSIVGRGTTLAELDELIETNRPDVVVVDNELADGLGSAWLIDHQRAAQVMVLFTSSVPVTDLAGTGCLFVSKTLGPQMLVELVVAAWRSLPVTPE